MFKVYLKVILTLFFVCSSIVVVATFDDFDSDLLNSIEHKERTALKFKDQDPKTLFDKLDGEEKIEAGQPSKSSKFSPVESMENLKYYNSPYERFPEYKKKPHKDINSLFKELHNDLKGNSYEYQMEKLALARQEAAGSEGYLRHLKTKFLKLQNNQKSQLNKPSETRPMYSYQQPFESNNYKTPLKAYNMKNEYRPNLNVSSTIQEGSKYLKNYENHSDDFGYKVPGSFEKTDSHERNPYPGAFERTVNQEKNPYGKIEIYKSNKNAYPNIEEDTATPNPNVLFALLDEDLDKGDWYQQGLKDSDILYLQGRYPKLFEKVNNAIHAKKSKEEDKTNQESENNGNWSPSFDTSQYLNKFSDLYKDKNRLPLKNNQESDSSMYNSKSQQSPTKTVSQSIGDNRNWSRPSDSHQYLNKFSDLYKDKSRPNVKSNQESDSSKHDSISQQVPTKTLSKNILESESPKGKNLLPLGENKDSDITVYRSKIQKFPAKIILIKTLEPETPGANSKWSLPSDKKQNSNRFSSSIMKNSRLPLKSNQESNISMYPETPQHVPTKTITETSENNRNWSPPSDKRIYFNKLKIGDQDRRKINVNRLEQYQNMNRFRKKPLIMHRLQNSENSELPKEPMLKLKVIIHDSQVNKNNGPKPKSQNLLQKLENFNAYDVLTPQSKPEAVLHIKTANNTLHIQSLNPSEQTSGGPQRNLVLNSKPSANNKNILIDNGSSNVPIPRLLELYDDLCTAQLRDPNYLQPVPTNKLRLNRKSNDFTLDENNVPNRESLRHMLKVLRKYKTHVSTLLRDASDLEMGVMEAIIEQLGDSSDFTNGQDSTRSKDNSKVSLSDGNERRNFNKNNEHRDGKITERNRKNHAGSSHNSVHRKSYDRGEFIKSKSSLGERKMKKSTRMQENSRSYKSGRAPKGKNVSLVKYIGNSKFTKPLEAKLKGEDDEDEDDDRFNEKIPFVDNDGKVKKFASHKKIKYVNEGGKVAKYNDEGKTCRQMQSRNENGEKCKKYTRNKEIYKNERRERPKNAKFGALDRRLGKIFLRTKETFTEKPELPDKSDLEYYEDLKGDEKKNRDEDYYVDD